MPGPAGFVDEAGYGQYFPHRVSYGPGIEGHQAPYNDNTGFLFLWRRLRLQARIGGPIGIWKLVIGHLIWWRARGGERGRDEGRRGRADGLPEGASLALIGRHLFFTGVPWPSAWRATSRAASMSATGNSKQQRYKRGLDMAGAAVKEKPVCAGAAERKSRPWRAGKGQSVWVNRHAGLLAGQTPCWTTLAPSKIR
jgi:hypothetical protein